jgi:hypothetical protein
MSSKPVTAIPGASLGARLDDEHHHARDHAGDVVRDGRIRRLDGHLSSRSAGYLSSLTTKKALP